LLNGLFPDLRPLLLDHVIQSQRGDGKHAAEVFVAALVRTSKIFCAFDGIFFNPDFPDSLDKLILLTQNKAA
jgi:hypothetical protein